MIAYFNEDGLTWSFNTITTGGFVIGFEALRRIKADLRTERILVVGLSSLKEQLDRIEYNELGVNSYIQKPMDFHQ